MIFILVKAIEGKFQNGEGTEPKNGFLYEFGLKANCDANIGLNAGTCTLLSDERIPGMHVDQEFTFHEYVKLVSVVGGGVPKGTSVAGGGAPSRTNQSEDMKSIRDRTLATDHLEVGST